MKIWAKNENGDIYEACTLRSRDGSKKVYKCFPPSNNKNEASEEFETIDGAVDYLKKNPDWGIRMRLRPPPPSIFYRSVFIDDGSGSIIQLDELKSR